MYIYNAFIFSHYYIISVENCINGTLGYAKGCFFDDVNNIPLAGFINFCPEVCIVKVAI